MVKMVLGEVQTQTSEIKEYCRVYEDALEAVSRSTSGILLAIGMTGEGMDSIKNYLSTAYPALCQAGILHSEATVSANESYVEAYTSKFGSEDLDSEELEERIQELNSLISEQEAFKEGLENQKQNLSKEPSSIILSIAYQSMILFSGMAIQRNQEKKGKLEKKLQDFLAFSEGSTSYFTGLSTSENLLSRGMQALGANGDGSIGAGSWNGVGFSAYKTDWIKEVNKNWETREKELQKLRNEKVLKQYAEIDANGNITGLRLSELAELLWKTKNPDDLTLEEKYALLKIYQHMTNVDRYEQALFNQLSFLITPILGFTYNEAGDYYYTGENSLQSIGGFTDIFDEFGPLFGMDLDTEIIYFEANGKEYRLQLWKGSYGFGNAYGAEIGLYYKNPDGTELDTKLQNQVPGWYACVEEEDQLKMKQYIYDKQTGEELIVNDTRKYAENGDHFWNLAIRTDDIYGSDAKSQLMTISEIEVPDEEMRKNMYQALKNDKDIDGVFVEGDIVLIKWKN